jgi:DNA repair protein RadD
MLKLKLAFDMKKAGFNRSVIRWNFDRTSRRPVDAVYNHLRTRDDNPCVVLPTGTGKSVVIAKIVRDAVSQWNGRVLILACEGALEQNAGKIEAFCPDIPIGVYSAGLKCGTRKIRDRRRNPIGLRQGMRSRGVRPRRRGRGAFDRAGRGRDVRTFLRDMQVVNPNVRLIGLTATPFRLKADSLPADNLLNEVCYEAGLKEMIGTGICRRWFRGPDAPRRNWTAPYPRRRVRGDEIASAMDTEELVSWRAGNRRADAGTEVGADFHLRR